MCDLSCPPWELISASGARQAKQQDYSHLSELHSASNEAMTKAIAVVLQGAEALQSSLATSENNAQNDLATL